MATTIVDLGRSGPDLVLIGSGPIRILILWTQTLSLLRMFSMACVKLKLLIARRGLHRLPTIDYFGLIFSSSPGDLILSLKLPLAAALDKSLERLKALPVKHISLS